MLKWRIVELENTFGVKSSYKFWIECCNRDDAEKTCKMLNISKKWPDKWEN